MIPLRDTIPSKNYPVINNCLIGINVVIFLLEMIQGGGTAAFTFTYGLVPARYVQPQYREYFSLGQQLLSFVSFMFLHGGIWHLVSNMWSLYIFGDNVEDHLGSLRYLWFYLLSGICSGLIHVMFNWGSQIPVIGASGAVAGVMGAYFILYPRARILTLVPVLFIPLFFEIPAFVFLGIWFLVQVFNATIGQMGASGIAWWAHIGGFIAGFFLLRFLGSMPSAGISDRLRNVTAKKGSEKLQVVKVSANNENLNLSGSINVTTVEALGGCRKIVHIPWGFNKSMYEVKVPSKMIDGQILRLKGIGRKDSKGRPGDLMLKVNIHSID